MAADILTFETYKKELQNAFPHLKIRDISNQVLTPKYVKLTHFGDEKNTDTIFVMDLKNPNVSNFVKKNIHLKNKAILLQYSGHYTLYFSNYIFHKYHIERYIQNEEEQLYCSICFEDFNNKAYHSCPNCGIPWCDKCFIKLIKNSTVECSNCKWIQEVEEFTVI